MVLGTWKHAITEFQRKRALAYDWRFWKKPSTNIDIIWPSFFYVFFLKNKLKKTVYIVMFSSHL